MSFISIKKWGFVFEAHEGIKHIFQFSFSKGDIL